MLGLLSSSTGGSGPKEAAPDFQKERQIPRPRQDRSHTTGVEARARADWVSLDTCSKHWTARLPGRVGARCPNGAIREANRGWMKGKALQEAGAAWDVGPHKK